MVRRRGLDAATVERLAAHCDVLPGDALRTAALDRDEVSHQDGHPWRERGIIDALTLWVAVDPATAENGCLRVIPGSHCSSPASPHSGRR